MNCCNTTTASGFQLLVEQNTSGLQLGPQKQACLTTESFQGWRNSTSSKGWEVAELHVLHGKEGWLKEAAKTLRKARLRSKHSTEQKGTHINPKRKLNASK
jgi:hypothetical protein